MLTSINSHLGSIPCVLIFSHISERDGPAMLRIIAQTLQEHSVTIDHLILTTYQERLDEQQSIGEPQIAITLSAWPDFVLDRPFKIFQGCFLQEIQQEYVSAWRVFQPSADVSVEPTVEEALSLAKGFNQGQGVLALVTGSLYLVGTALRLLEPST